jgi:signal transduction histidine kinase
MGLATNSRRLRERRSPDSRIPELAALSAPLIKLSVARRSAPLLYIELTGIERVAKHRRLRALAACKRAVASSLRAAVGTVLRRSDAVAAGMQARWFVALLVDRAVAAPARASVDDADLGLICSRLQAAIRARLRVLERRGVLPASIGVIGGWTVLDPVSAERPLAELRQAVRGAAVVARVEARRATVLASVTHELRTPLTSIIGYAERLRDEPELAASVRARYSDIVAQEGRRLHRLVESLIDIGAWSAGRLKLAVEHVKLQALVRAAWAAVGDRASAKALRLEVRGDVAASVDAERMEQVLINVLDNAARHSPNGGRVRVALERDATSCCVTVIDEGPGFTRAAARQLGSAFAPDANGRAGLGLSIARLLVDAHGGTLSLGRAARGACLRIRLPASAGREV